MSSTRERLLASAWSVLQREGPAAATSRRITEVAGANLAAITYHFGSKDALLGEAIVGKLRSWTEPLTAALTEDDADIVDYDARVATAVAVILQRFTEGPEELQPLLALVLADTEIPGIRDALVTWLGELRAVATDVMVRQQANGLIPATVDPPVLAAAFTALALGLVAQASLDPAAPSTPSVVAAFLALLVRPPAPSAG